LQGVHDSVSGSTDKLSHEATIIQKDYHRFGNKESQEIQLIGASKRP